MLWLLHSLPTAKSSHAQRKQEPCEAQRFPANIGSPGQHESEHGQPHSLKQQRKLLHSQHHSSSANSEQTITSLTQPKLTGCHTVSRPQGTIAQHKSWSWFTPNKPRTLWFGMLSLLLLSLAGPSAADTTGTCPVSIDYAVSLGGIQSAGDNSNVPIFVGSVGITNHANVSGHLRTTFLDYVHTVTEQTSRMQH